MSQLEVNKVLPQSGTTLTLGESGDTITVPSGATLDVNGIDFPTADGTAGQVLQTNGSGVLSFGSVSGGFKSMQVFSTAGSFTYTKPSGINLIKVYVTGGGGGGGKGGSSEAAGGGGGAGGTAIKVINATSITTETVTIGAGGASETAGSTSSFGSHCSATGGEKGLNAFALAGDTEGGVGSSGDINLYGQAGGGAADETTGGKTGGLGGSSFWGGGGYGIYNTTGLVGYHGGGGGGGQRASGNIGGAGGAGICVVEEYS
jgi:hypothetical protein